MTSNAEYLPHDAFYSNYWVERPFDEVFYTADQH